MICKFLFDKTNISCILRKPVFGVSHQGDTNQAVQSQKMASGFKFQIKEVEELYYLFNNQSRTNGPINAHLTIAQVMPKYNHNNEKQEALV